MPTEDIRQRLEQLTMGLYYQNAVVHDMAAGAWKGEAAEVPTYVDGNLLAQSEWIVKILMAISHQVWYTIYGKR